MGTDDLEKYSARSGRQPIIENPLHPNDVVPKSKRMEIAIRVTLVSLNLLLVFSKLKPSLLLAPIEYNKTRICVSELRRPI